jgi:glycine cleavage system H protein
MNYPNDRRYTNEHEWARKDGSQITVGITHYAQDSLGDIVFVELPAVGAKVTKGQSFGVVESTKAVSELFAPLSGTVAEVNSPLADAPETVNTDPHGGAWIIKITPDNSGDYDALMDADQYTKFLAESGH